MTQPPRRNRTLKIVLIVIGVVVLLCCGGTLVGGYFLFDGVTKEPRAATDLFLGNLETGNFADAYDELCSATKTTMEEPTFENTAQQHKPVSHSVNWGGSYSNTEGDEQATITADVSDTAGSKSSHVFQLHKESNVWKVCNPF